MMCRKSILEVEFLEEEGTGLGPTLEFFALVAAEFQRTGIVKLFVITYCILSAFWCTFLDFNQQDNGTHWFY
jgi:hypothetical protein